MHHHKPPHSLNYFGQHLIPHYNKKEYTIVYDNNHFKLEIGSTSLQAYDPNSPFALEFLKYKDTTPDESRK